MMIIFLVLITVCLAAFTQGIIGFGFALISMPILSIILGVKTAVPLIALTGFCINLYLFLKFRNKIHKNEIIFLLLGSLISVPIGVNVLKYLSENFLMILLALIVFFYLIVSALKVDYKISYNWKKTFIWGFLAGFFGGALNTNGPVIIIYSKIRGHQKDEFRALLANFFFFMGIFLVSNHIIFGIINVNILEYFLILIVPMMLCLHYGFYFYGKIIKEKFEIIIKVFLGIIGLLLIIKSIY